MKKALLIVAMCIGLTSCYTTRTYVGNIKPGEPTIKVNELHVHHLLCGLVPISNHEIEPTKYINKHKNFVVKNQLTFIDGLIGTLTGGIYTPSTVTFEIPIDEIKE